MSRTYERLDIEHFGAHLITSQDLDPIYAALCSVDWNEELIKRWLVAYWCFYSAGVACWAANEEGLKFWHGMKIAAENKLPTHFGERWPRAHERRHFRGAACLKAIYELEQLYPQPEMMVNFVVGLPDQNGRTTCGDVMKRVGQHHLFGPWIGFKVADMLERVLGIPVDFSQSEVFMFDQPREAALMLYKQRAKLPEDAKLKDEGAAISAVVKHLVEHFAKMGLSAPPDRDRPIGLQEVETVLCKWKSHMNGHYPLWNDVDEIGKGLVPWATHPALLAHQLLEAMPKRARS